MEQRQGIIVSLTGRRGRGPGYLTFDDGSEIGSFEPALLKTAAANINATVDYTWEEKPGKKDPAKVGGTTPGRHDRRDPAISPYPGGESPRLGKIWASHPCLFTRCRVGSQLCHGRATA